VIAGGAALWATRRGAPHYPYTGTPVAAGPVIPLALPDDQGGHFDLSQHRGNVVLIYFGYTHCPDVCPTTLAMISATMAQLGLEARRVLPVFVTLDPGRDTAPMLRDYLANFEPPLLGLTADQAAIAAAARDWSITWRIAEGGAYIDHSSVVTAVGPDGRVRLRYGFSQLEDTQAVAQDIEHLLHDG
jgi:protein SCO1/2